MTANGAITCARAVVTEILKKDREIILREASSHTSVSLAATVNWLRVWEEVREKGPYWTKIIQNSLSSSLRTPVFSHYNCPKCGDTVYTQVVIINFIEHIPIDHF